MTTSKKPKASPKSVTPTPSASASSGSQADFDQFIAAARAIPAAEIVPLRADLNLALQNAQVGVAAVLAETSRVAKLPESNVKTIASVPAVLLATIYASTQVSAAASTGELAKLLATGRGLRSLLLKTADSLAEAGLLSAAAVTQIRKGSGALDAARDCVALAALFTKNAATIKGKHAVSAAQIKQASEVGTQLLTILKPGRARVAKPAVSSAAFDRDRLWTLALQRWDGVWRAGAYLFGHDAVEEKVPLLQSSRVVRPKKSAAKPTPTPAAPTGAATPATAK